jgi:hypothetical protein
MVCTSINLIRYQPPYLDILCSGRNFREIGFGDETRISASAIKIDLEIIFNNHVRFCVGYILLDKIISM